MAMSAEEYNRASAAEIRAKLAAQQEGPTASPSVPYTKYVLEDLNMPAIHPDLQRGVFDKEIPLANISEARIPRLRMGYRRAEINFKNSRPTYAGGNNEEIIYSILPVKSEIKLSRAIDGFQTKQLSTMTTVRRIETPAMEPAPMGGRFSFLRRGKK